MKLIDLLLMAQRARSIWLAFTHSRPLLTPVQVGTSVGKVCGSKSTSTRTILPTIRYLKIYSNSNFPTERDHIASTPTGELSKNDLPNAIYGRKYKESHVGVLRAFAQDCSWSVQSPLGQQATTPAGNKDVLQQEKTKRGTCHDTFDTTR